MFSSPTTQRLRFPSTTLVLVSAFLLFVPGKAAAGGPSEGGRTSIVYIMADDLGIGDVNCYGGRLCRVATPHFDRLAREGMRFTDAHTVASVCVPARIAIMTGRYPWRFREPKRRGVRGFLTPRFSTDQFTLGDLMRGAGYRTGYVGKWHLGTQMQTTNGQIQGSANVDYSKPLVVGPVQVGFDDSFILPGSLDMYPYAFLRNNHWLGQVTAQKGWSAFNRVGPAAEDFEDHLVLDTFSQEAERFISENAPAAKSGKPFFLYLALTAPHTPISPRAEFRGKSAIGPYGDFVMETDDCIGRVLDALDAHGLADDTLVIATSDHGAAPCVGLQHKAASGQIRELEKIGHYPSGKYRGYKFSAYEGGLRVPFVARWPKVIEAGSVCSALVGLNDLMATFADIARTRLTDDQSPDSISFLPLLEDPSSLPPRTSLVLRSTQRFVIRDRQWKLILGSGCGCSGRLGNTPSERDAWTAAVKSLGREPLPDDLTRAPFVQLYDLASDPGESTDLALEHGERVEELIASLEQWIARGRSTPGTPLANDVSEVVYLPQRP